MSVRAGISSTTVVSGCLASSEHFFTQSLIALPYGGLQKTVCPPPRLSQSVVCYGKVPVALVIGLISAGIEGEVKLRIQLVKERLRRRPVHSSGREHDFCIHFISPHNLCLYKNGLIRDLVAVGNFYLHIICYSDTLVRRWEANVENAPTVEDVAKNDDIQTPEEVVRRFGVGFDAGDYDSMQYEY